MSIFFLFKFCPFRHQPYHQFFNYCWLTCFKILNHWIIFITVLIPLYLLLHSLRLSILFIVYHCVPECLHPVFSVFVASLLISRFLWSSILAIAFFLLLIISLFIVCILKSLRCSFLLIFFLVHCVAVRICVYIPYCQ